MGIEPGILSLLVFGVMIVFWTIDRLPMAFISMAGCIVCVVLGISTLPQAMSGFTNDLIFLVAGMEIVGIALLKSGLAHVVGRAVLKFAKNDEKRLMIISFCIATGMSAFMSNMTIVVLFLIIFRGVVHNSNKFNIKNITLPAIAGAVVGGACTLIGSTPQLAGQSVIESLQGTQNFADMRLFEMFDFTPIGIPIAIVTGLAIYFYAYPHSKKMWARNKKQREEAGANASVSTQSAGDEPVTIDLLHKIADKKNLYIMTGITVLLLVLLISELVTVGTAAMIAALLSIITGCVSQKQAFTEMNWNIVIWLAGCFGIAEVLNISGGMAILTNGLSVLVSENFPPFLFFALVTLICMIVTQFISNTACVLIFMPIFLSMTTAMGISPYPIAMGVIYGASLAFLTPLASAQIGMAVSVGHSFKEIVRYGLVLHVVMYIAAIITIPLVFPL